MEVLERLYNHNHIHNAKDLQIAAGKSVPMKTIKEFLKNNETQQIHSKRYKNNYPVRHSLYSFPYEMTQMDLIDLTGYQQHYHFALTFIDCFSRYAHVIALKTKSADEMVVSLKIIVKDITEKLKFKIGCIQSDNGTEFTNAKVKKYLKTANI